MKCQVNECFIFMHQDSAYYYNSSVYGKLQESYLKGKSNLICDGCEEEVSLRVSEKQEKARRNVILNKVNSHFQRP